MNAASSPLPGEVLLETDRLSLRVGSRWLCREVSLQVRAGECLMILGPNGAGKTTLLHTLAGLNLPASGKVCLNGQPYAAWAPRAAARLRGFLPQQASDAFPATVRDAVLVGRHPHLGRWHWEGAAEERMACEALQSVGLASLAGRDVLTLSGGERQRVAIAALLVQQPRLFLLDEPLNHLDLHYQIAMLDLFRKRAQEGCGVVIVIHDINLAARYADKIVLLDGEGGVQAGLRETVLQAGILGKVFGHPLHCHWIEGRPFFVPQ